MCCCCCFVAIIICILSAMNFSLLSGCLPRGCCDDLRYIACSTYVTVWYWALQWPPTPLHRPQQTDTGTTVNIIIFLIFWCHGLVSWLHAIQIHRFLRVLWGMGWNGTGEVTGRCWNTKDELKVRFPIRIVWDIIILASRSAGANRRELARGRRGIPNLCISKWRRIELLQYCKSLGSRWVGTTL